MTQAEQLTQLLEKSRKNELLPFLQSLTEKERKELGSLSRTLAKDYLEYRESGGTWRHKATDVQREILNYILFVCGSAKDFERHVSSGMLRRDFLKPVLSWHTPSWFNSYVNAQVEKRWGFVNLGYDYLLQLADDGYLQPSPLLITRELVPYIFEQSFESRNRNDCFVPEKLQHHPLTLAEHVWYLFQFETAIHVQGRYCFVGKQPLNKSWADAFLSLSQQNLLPRQRLLREALLASNRNFNKNLSAWFAQLFEKLEPTAAELLLLQDELFTLFVSPHGAVVNAALQATKKIIAEEGFDAEQFLGHAPVLLASPTKAVLNAALQLLERIAKDKAALRAEICSLATAAFVHKDEAVQLRAAKLLQKFGKTDDEALKASVAACGAALFSGAREVLADYLLDEPQAEAEQEQFAPAAQTLSETDRLPQPQTVDELVFLAAQAFDNNQSWHVDLLPEAILQLHRQISSDDLPKFEPAVQRALKFFFGDWRSTQGQLDRLLAVFFLDYILLLVRRFPEGGASLSALFKTFMDKSEENKKIWAEHGAVTSFFHSWEGQGEIYAPHQRLLHATLNTLQHDVSVSLLSVPTHAPGWIEPLALVQRLAEHQQQNIVPDDTDLQMALSRCWLHETGAALAAVETGLHGELQRLLRFLLQPGAEPQGPFGMEAAWMTAVLAKSPGTVYPQLAGLAHSALPREQYTGQFAWRVLLEDYTVDRYEWTGGKMKTIKEKKVRKALRLADAAAKKDEAKESGLKKFFAKFSGPAKPPTPVAPLLYDALRIDRPYLNTEDRDVRRIYFLTPANPEPLMALTMRMCLAEPTFLGEPHKRFLLEVLKAYHDAPVPLGETGHLLIATSMVCADKTAAAYAAEIWLRGVTQQSLDSARIGHILGRQQAIEFVPLKRFTDLALSRLMGVSGTHNLALQTMVEAMLAEMPDSKAKGVKKLREMAAELVRLNGRAAVAKLASA